MRTLVTGGAGFIGSHFVDRLLAAGHDVVAYDNFSTGQERFLDQALTHPRFQLIRGDLLDRPALAAGAQGIDLVFHFAANADVRFGLEWPERDLQQNAVATFNVLEAMRANGVTRIVFASTGSVYGEPDVFPTPEDAPFPRQTSLYGAAKLAGEALVQAYCEGYGFQGYIFRFVSILGERYSHGHVFDFYRQLRAHPDTLHVLGDGHQRKSYIYVHDCLDAIFCALERAVNRVNIFNLGTDEYCEVNDSVRWLTRELGLSPVLSYTGGARGWVGDSPFIFLDCRRIRSLGWRPALSIQDAIVRTVRYLRANEWLLDARR
ncbi:MAG: nucleoside-diphosphate sugar epimerase [Acidobacteria bacterium RIFCSPLOWO2_02_FULL_68_18]|nr:MAG: nucleoside-diphosphate sugar epimerase [Acidobacteria bacterium RIFCSPLOWO2_02_FULL_68_18]OFW51550.1 MAG: nucleoside-diphosphate sugar epimerase [Acidobacteria bacterium RIFCSPLOWO2_12_FULL_68_19]